MYPTYICKVVTRKTTFYYQPWGSSDVGMLSESYHKINLIVGEKSY